MVVLSMEKPIIKVKVDEDGKTLFADEKGLYEDWLYCCPDKEYLKAFKTKSNPIRR